MLLNYRNRNPNGAIEKM